MLSECHKVFQVLSEFSLLFFFFKFNNITFLLKSFTAVKYKKNEIKKVDNETTKQTYVERIIFLRSYKEQKRWWPIAIDNRVRATHPVR